MSVGESDRYHPDWDLFFTFTIPLKVDQTVAKNGIIYSET
jgi:hypothetical protein